MGELRKNNVSFKIDHFNPHIKNLMKKMLCIYEKDRPSWEEVFNVKLKNLGYIFYISKWNYLKTKYFNEECWFTK